jgi:hypothetical protein
MHEILERFGDKRRMNLEQLDGFIAAMLCGPYEVPQSEYVTEIWGDNIADGEAFTAHGMLQDFVSLITRHRDAIAHTQALFTHHCYSKINRVLFMGIIGQVDSCVVWNCAKKIGLRYWTTMRMVVLLCPFSRWYTNMILILRFGHTTSQLIQNYGKS